MQVVPNIIKTVEGRNVTVMCNVTGNPKPGALIWKKSDELLSSARTFVREGNLTILNITTKDNGPYVCTATNPLGHQIIVSSPSCLFSSQIQHRRYVEFIKFTIIRVQLKILSGQTGKIRALAWTSVKLYLAWGGKHCSFPM